MDMNVIEPSFSSLNFYTENIHICFFTCRLHQLAGQLRDVHRRVRDGHFRGASGEQTVSRRNNGDGCHDGTVL